MQMDVGFVEKFIIQPELFGTRTDKRQGGARRFVHHIPNGARDLKSLRARHAGRFHEQDVAAVGGPRQPGHNTRDGHALVEFLARQEDGVVEIFLHTSRGDGRFRQFLFSDARPDLAADRAYLALKVANACLARVLTDDLAQSFVLKRDLLHVQAVLPHLPRNKVALRNGDLFVFSVT